MWDGVGCAHVSIELSEASSGIKSRELEQWVFGSALHGCWKLHLVPDC